VPCRVSAVKTPRSGLDTPERPRAGFALLEVRRKNSSWLPGACSPEQRARPRDPAPRDLRLIHSRGAAHSRGVGRRFLEAHFQVVHAAVEMALHVQTAALKYHEHALIAREHVSAKTREPVGPCRLRHAPHQA
jgi:hypothetical protein